MPSFRLSGSLTALSPIMITRPGQGDTTLTMNVIRNESHVRAHVIPGETIKGLLRGMAYRLCVDAARHCNNGKPPRVSLEMFYRQTLGGLGFEPEIKQLGNDRAARREQPLLSLFGAASPKITGRLIVHHGISLITLSNRGDDVVLAGGTRRDPLTLGADYPDMLEGDQKELWARQNRAISEMTVANRRLEDAKRILARAKRTEGAETKTYEAELEAAQAVVAAIKATPDFQHSIQRPLPTKPAAPAGTIYEHGFEIQDGSPDEIGLFFAAMDMWRQHSRIGGGETTGYGQIAGSYAVERLTDEPLSRDRRWINVGRLTIGGENPGLTVSDPVLLDALAAWRIVEAEIMTKTKIFA